MVKKLKVHYYRPFMSCSDYNYISLVKALHDYLLRYNFFTFTTTIEGAFINDYSYDFALNFLEKNCKSKSSFDNFNSYISELKVTDRTNLLRLVFNGKSDLLAKYNKIENMLPQDTNNIIKGVKLDSKTSGWISKFIDEYFKTNSKIDGPFNPKSFYTYISDEKNRKSVLMDFQRNFPELFKLMNNICGMLVK
jgi:hypothetical protein